jgi:hypothetical protein
MLEILLLPSLLFEHKFILVLSVQPGFSVVHKEAEDRRRR